MRYQMQIIDATNEFFMNNGGTHPTWIQFNQKTRAKILDCINWDGYIIGTKLKVGISNNIDEDTYVIGTEGLFSLTKKLQ